MLVLTTAGFIMQSFIHFLDKDHWKFSILYTWNRWSSASFNSNLSSLRRSIISPFTVNTRHFHFAVIIVILKLDKFDISLTITYNERHQNVIQFNRVYIANPSLISFKHLLIRLTNTLRSPFITETTPLFSIILKQKRVSGDKTSFAQGDYYKTA